MTMDASNDGPFSSTRSRHAEQHSQNSSSVVINPKNQTKAKASSDIQLRQLFDLGLTFLSTCSNESLLVVLLCIMGATYIVLGRLGLLLIGAALGVSLHASWEGVDVNQSSSTRSFNRKQASLNMVHQLMEWRKNKRVRLNQNNAYAGQCVIEDDARVYVDISSFGPLTAAALHSLVDATVRDYVK